MTIAYIRPLNPPGDLSLVEIIAIVPGSPPPRPSPGPGDPPGTWGGGNVPMPNPPIANVPGLPPHPDLPPIDPVPPPVDLVIKAPPEGGGWGYVSTWGWVYKPKVGEAGPK